MTPKECLENIINKALLIFPEKLITKEAKAMLLAIGLQESLLTYRKQINGPARGLWQFEMNGGVRGVLTHPSTKNLANKVCSKYNVIPTKEMVYKELSENDELACCFARLLLYTIPDSLPNIDSPDKGWKQYSKQSWNPGKPHRDKWDDNFKIGWETVNYYD